MVTIRLGQTQRWNMPLPLGLFAYIKIKSYEKATLHSRNPSFQPVQFCRVRRPDRQHPVRLQRRKKAEERSFRIHDQ